MSCRHIQTALSHTLTQFLERGDDLAPGFWVVWLQVEFCVFKTPGKFVIIVVFCQCYRWDSNFEEDNLGEVLGLVKVVRSEGICSGRGTFWCVLHFVHCTLLRTEMRINW